jgi:hypothetical protein
MGKTTSKTRTYVIYSWMRRWVKIGKAGDVIRRCRELEIACGEPLHILLVLDGDQQNELHDRFAHLRIGGEWFLYDEEIRDFVLAELLALGKSDKIIASASAIALHDEDDLTRLRDRLAALTRAIHPEVS